MLLNVFLKMEAVGLSAVLWSSGLLGDRFMLQDGRFFVVFIFVLLPQERFRQY